MDEKISHTQKAQKALKALKGTKTLRQKHKNANKRISDYFPLRCFLEAFFYFYLLVSVLGFFVVVKVLNKGVYNCLDDLIYITNFMYKDLGFGDM